MNKIKHKKCFGKMFPNSPHVGNQVSSEGKVFSVRETPFGGLIGPNRSVQSDIDEWDDCQNCSEFESCYKLCLGKVALEFSTILR